jgi:hypothetical protein
VSLGELSRAELREAVLRLAGEPQRWAHLVRHRPGERTYVCLVRDERMEAWLICWMRDGDTGFHDHDLSAGAVAVVRGQVREDRLVLGSSPRVRTLGAGEVFDFAAADIHRVRHVGDAPAVTLHVYSPPLWRMGMYELDPGGLLRRHSISSAEELRPLT